MYDIGIFAWWLYYIGYIAAANTNSPPNRCLLSYPGIRNTNTRNGSKSQQQEQLTVIVIGYLVFAVANRCLARTFPVQKDCGQLHILQRVVLRLVSSPIAPVDMDTSYSIYFIACELASEMYRC